MKAMILAAGRGTRLRPLTDTTPKPMLPVQGRPLIEHQLMRIRAAGITDVVINLHHLGDVIRNHLGDGNRFGVRIQYSEEAQLLETGGGIVNALPLLGNAPFLIYNGDIYCDLNLRLLMEPLSTDLARFALVPTPGTRTHGDFEVADGRVTARGEPYVYCGIALYHPDLFAGCEPVPFSLNTLMFRAVAENRVAGVIHQGVWSDIGSPEELQRIRSGAIA